MEPLLRPSHLPAPARTPFNRLAGVIARPGTALNCGKVDLVRTREVIFGRRDFRPVLPDGGDASAHARHDHR